MIPLFTANQVREADRYAIEQLKIPSLVLMENASKSIFDQIRMEFSDLDNYSPIGIVAGKGNNGGDGFALARHFINNDFNVLVISIAKESELKGDALINYRILKNLMKNQKNSKIIHFGSIKDINLLSNCSLIIDALLGTGSKGSLSGSYKNIIKKLNKLNAWKVAVDIPTGLDIDTSTGDFVFEADLTVTLAEYKRGLFYGKGYVNCGRIAKGYIGVGKEFFDEFDVNDYLIEPEDAFFSLPIRNLDAHKYSAGKVLTIAGSGLLPGASFFAANSALKVGAGASILAFPESIKSLAQTKLDGAIVQPYSDESKEYLSMENIEELSERIIWADVVAIGPGLGRERETGDAVIEILKRFAKKKYIIDADALYALNGGKYKRIDLKEKVLTPHHKEFADLIGIKINELQNNILEIGKGFVKQTGAYLVLKGAPTIIFTPMGEVYINSSGNPGMAKFGTGDVLTGMIAGIISQNKKIEGSIITSVYLHGLTADLLLEKKTDLGITASDIMEHIPNAIKFLEDSIIQSS